MPLQIIRQDITKMRVDAIVNTTNDEMFGYSGVDLAVHTVAGPELDAECESIAPLGVGEAKITGGYNLPCKYVIHTSGPVWEGGLRGERILLRSCYLESLKMATAYRCNSIAFPLISAGTYGYPKQEVLKFAIRTITEYLFDHELMVYICVFDKESYEFSQALFQDIRSFIDDDYVEEREDDFYEGYKEDAIESLEMCDAMPAPLLSSAQLAKQTSLRDYLREMDKSFGEMLFELIDKSGVTDVECYKRANIDKRTFSKIKSNPKTYRPSKQTAIAFAISLKLDMETTQNLLATAGMTLSRSNTFDKIIRYFIHRGNYDIFEINEALFEFDQVLLGC